MTEETVISNNQTFPGLTLRDQPDKKSGRSPHQSHEITGQVGQFSHPELCPTLDESTPTRSPAAVGELCSMADSNLRANTSYLGCEEPSRPSPFQIQPHVEPFPIQLQTPPQCWRPQAELPLLFPEQTLTPAPPHHSYWMNVTPLGPTPHPRSHNTPLVLVPICQCSPSQPVVIPSYTNPGWCECLPMVSTHPPCTPDLVSRQTAQQVGEQSVRMPEITELREQQVESEGVEKRETIQTKSYISHGTQTSWDVETLADFIYEEFMTTMDSLCDKEQENEKLEMEGGSFREFVDKMCNSGELFRESFDEILEQLLALISANCDAASPETEETSQLTSQDEAPPQKAQSLLLSSSSAQHDPNPNQNGQTTFQEDPLPTCATNQSSSLQFQAANALVEDSYFTSFLRDLSEAASASPSNLGASKSTQTPQKLWEQPLTGYPLPSNKDPLPSSEAVSIISPPAFSVPAWIALSHLEDSLKTLNLDSPCVDKNPVLEQANVSVVDYSNEKTGDPQVDASSSESMQENQTLVALTDLEVSSVSARQSESVDFEESGQSTAKPAKQLPKTNEKEHQKLVKTTEELKIEEGGRCKDNIQKISMETPLSTNVAQEKKGLNEGVMGEESIPQSQKSPIPTTIRSSRTRQRSKSLPTSGDEVERNETHDLSGARKPNVSKIKRTRKRRWSITNRTANQDQTRRMLKVAMKE
ncbi:uncharacterized protein LOC117807104 isoform X3 [Xyrichtys novacula]|uniref:Uncharacterized protein LOC117807104 isoform X3 n=1 Tax=Xyrichtys novacula TaxID=13765 RepID=A0AAV1HJ63_XYRNO|nr:uncharacterized protein LOC117807104 isoform X3 [Xyrichtys novacula]